MSCKFNCSMFYPYPDCELCDYYVPFAPDCFFSLINDSDVVIEFSLGVPICKSFKLAKNVE